MKRSAPLIRRAPLVARSELKRGGPIRHKAKSTKPADEKAHLASVAVMPCCVTGGRPVVLHHVMHMPGKRCRRDDRYVVPLIAALHNMGDLSVHMLGSEAEFLRVHGVDLIETAKALWAHSSNS